MRKIETERNIMFYVYIYISYIYKERDRERGIQTYTYIYLVSRLTAKLTVMIVREEEKELIDRQQQNKLDRINIAFAAL